MIFLNACFLQYINISGTIFQVGCCGVDNYNDFTGATGWVTVYPSYTLITPLACCKTLPSSSDYTCATSGGATESTNYLNTV